MIHALINTSNELLQTYDFGEESPPVLAEGKGLKWHLYIDIPPTVTATQRYERLETVTILETVASQDYLIIDLTQEDIDAKAAKEAFDTYVGDLPYADMSIAHFEAVLGVMSPVLLASINTYMEGIKANPASTIVALSSANAWIRGSTLNPRKPSTVGLAQTLGVSSVDYQAIFNATYALREFG
jgi:hypothetical protein